MTQLNYLLFFAFFLFIGCNNGNTQATESTPETTQANTPPPDKIEIRTLPDEKEFVFPKDLEVKTMDGKVISAKELLNDGKPTVLYFWLTTCGPCKRELKAITQEYESWKAETGVRLVAISTDFAKNEGKVYKTPGEKGWNFEVFWDYQRQFRNYVPGTLNGLPQAVVLDKNLNIVYHRRKYAPGDEKEMYEVIKQLTKG